MSLAEGLPSATSLTRPVAPALQSITSAGGIPEQNSRIAPASPSVDQLFTQLRAEALVHVETMFSAMAADMLQELEHMAVKEDEARVQRFTELEARLRQGSTNVSSSDSQQEDSPSLSGFTLCAEAAEFKPQTDSSDIVEDCQAGIQATAPAVERYCEGPSIDVGSIEAPEIQQEGSLCRRSVLGGSQLLTAKHLAPDEDDSSSWNEVASAVLAFTESPLKAQQRQKNLRLIATPSRRISSCSHSCSSQWSPLLAPIFEHMNFGFTLRRESINVDWGLEWQKDELGLVVAKVLPRGAVDAWNRMCFGGPAASKVVVRDDVIISVNGETEREAMLEQCQTCTLVKFEVERRSSELPWVPPFPF